MKKTFIVLASLVLALTLCFGALADSFQYPLEEIGLTVTIPEDYAEKRLSLVPTADPNGQYVALQLLYYDYDALEPYVEALNTAATNATSASDEAFTSAYAAYQEACNEHCALVATVLGISEEKAADNLAQFEADDAYTKFGTNCGYVYFTTYADNGDTSAFPGYDDTVNAVKDMLVSLAFTDIVVSESEPIASEITPFTATDMNGNTVTEAIFAEKDLTIVNVWQTTCTPCVNEMPELEALSKNLPENAQLIAIVLDVTGPDSAAYQDAQDILSAAGCDFTVLMLSDGLTDLVKNVTGVPTTLFFGKDGKAVHDPFVGASVDTYETIAEDYLASIAG